MPGEIKYPSAVIECPSIENVTDLLSVVEIREAAIQLSWPGAPSLPGGPCWPGGPS